jgi:uncharacterized protein DUF262
MKNFDSRTYSINDFLEWSNNKQLELNPKFQRRNVWSDRARSFLMDTIVRGKPIPKVFIRQRINATTKASIREVVDGQQRLRTILSYLKDGFMISKRHNETYGGRYFSQLGDVDDQIQANILNYEVSVDLLVNMPDAEVLDVFSRLNAYAVVLNEQEKTNASHFGPFKILADSLGHSYADYLVKNRILTPQRILRMDEVNLTADLLIAMIEGIKSKKQIKHFYDAYEEAFEEDVAALEDKFRRTVAGIETVFGDSLPNSEFRRVQLFYTLFTAFYHSFFGLTGFDLPRPTTDATQPDRVRYALTRVDELFAQKVAGSRLDTEADQFIEDSRRATTDAPVRARRTAFVVKLLNAV